MPPPAELQPPPVVVVPAPVVVAPAPPEPIPVAPPAIVEAEEKAEPETPWYSDISVGAFVDAYGAIRSDSNEARLPADGPASPVGYGHEAYVQASGFALAFAGLDVAYSGEKFGATISLRFGPGVNRFYGGDNGAYGLDNITQGFVTYKPTDSLTFDLGQFGTIYGAEVAESWRNVNYSRGALYYAMQPFWHTGLRANYKLNDVVAINALVVNGVNNAFEGNKSPSLGVQLVLTPTDSLLIAAGYLGALNPRDGDEETAATKNFENFFDAVATLTLDKFKLVANFDYNQYRPKGVKDSENWWGISVAPQFSFTDWLGLGARVEYLEDSANSQLIQSTTGKAKLTTLTGTLDIKPVPGSAALLLRPEFRYEIAGSPVYQDGEVGSDKLEKKFWSAHLGVVVTSMP